MRNNLIDETEKKFVSIFEVTPQMVFSPGRINLIGEHVDYNEGLVFPAAIDKGIAVAVQKAAPSQGNTCTAIALDLEETYTFELRDLAPVPDGGWRNYLIGVVAGLHQAGWPMEPFNIVFSGNVPAGSGLSSSAALENGIVFSLNELFGMGLSKIQMIKISQAAEHLFVGVQCGIMDQYASMFGEEDHFLLLDCKTLESRKFHIDLGAHELILINSNVKHNLSESTYNKRRALCEKVATLLGKEAMGNVTKEELDSLPAGTLTRNDYQKVLYVIQEIERTRKAVEVIEKNDITALGALLFETHRGLSEQYEVSCEELDFLVDLARRSPHVPGSRMMGGGFGGCTLNIISQEHTDAFLAQVQKTYLEKFGFECTPIKIKLSKGTHLIK